MKAIRTFLAFAGILSGLSMFVESAHARLAEPTIVFSRLSLELPRRAHLYLTDLDGLNIRQFTDSDEQEYSPSWTPDGNVLHGEWNAFVLRSSDGDVLERIPLETVQSPGQPAWSPTHRRIVFSALPKNEASRQIFLMDMQTYTLKRLTDLKDGAEWAQWSPDGRWTLFATEKDIAFADTNGNNFRLMTATDDKESYPSLSPDGETLAYVGENQFLYLLEIGARTKKPITGFPDVPMRGLAWTPDGNSLLFTTLVKETGRLHIIRRDGTGLRVILEMPGAALFEPSLHIPGLSVSPIGSKTLTWGALKRGGTTEP